MPEESKSAASSASGLPLVALGASCWGFDTVLRSPLTGDLSSSAIVFYEHALLTVVFAPYLFIHRNRLTELRGASWWAVLWISWGGSALGTICYTQAIKLGNPTTVVFLQKLQPLIAVALAGWLLHEREPRRLVFWLRAGLAIFAALLISFGSLPDGDALITAEGGAALFAVAAAAVWGSCTVFGRYVLPAVSPTLLTGLRVVGAVPLLGVLAVSTGGATGLPLPTSDHWPRLVLMALIPGLLGLTIYYRGLNRTPASLATLGELCFPASAALLNWLFLGTEVSVTQGFGVALLWFVVLWPRSVTR